MLPSQVTNMTFFRLRNLHFSDPLNLSYILLLRPPWHIILQIILPTALLVST